MERIIHGLDPKSESKQAETVCGLKLGPIIDIIIPFHMKPIRVYANDIYASIYVDLVTCESCTKKFSL